MDGWIGERMETGRFWGLLFLFPFQKQACLSSQGGARAGTPDSQLDVDEVKEKKSKVWRWMTDSEKHYKTWRLWGVSKRWLCVWSWQLFYQLFLLLLLPSWASCTMKRSLFLAKGNKHVMLESIHKVHRVECLYSYWLIWTLTEALQLHKAEVSSAIQHQ